MDIKITEHERIRVIDGQDIYGIMRKILLREERIDQEKEHFWMVGLDVSRRLLFIELVVIGGAYHHIVTQVLVEAAFKFALSFEHECKISAALQTDPDSLRAR
ncbi:MAG: hypothetical protein BECKG1743F_GA0114225_105681, partial [Candidatus Kentron sp. G]